MHHFDHSRLLDAPLNTSLLRARSYVWHSPRNHRSGGLLSFYGCYKPGSDGRDDAHFVRRTLLTFYEIYPVDGVVIDCRKLDYAWGDDLDFPNRSAFQSEQVPLFVVLQPDQTAAYGYAINQLYHRFDLDQALAEVSEAIRLMKSRL